MRNADGIVYSTDGGNTCPACRRPRAKCTCPRGKKAGRGPQDSVVRVGRQTQGRKGKGVTTITGVPLPPAELAGLAKELKRRFGSGGTLKDGVIEIQGEHRDRLVDLLQAKGWTVKRAGG